MTIKINGVEIAEYPQSFTVTINDIDGENSVRTSDGSLTRDRLAVKRKIEMDWGVVDWDVASSLLNAVSEVFFDIEYPDPMEGTQKSITAYVSDRPALVALSEGDSIKWSGMKMSIVER
jgi:hypothetical protein